MGTVASGCFFLALCLVCVGEVNAAGGGCILAAGNRLLVTWRAAWVDWLLIGFCSVVVRTQ